MTAEEFAKAKAVQEWWREITTHEWFPLILQESLRKRRYTEANDFVPQHLEHKSHGYKTGYAEALDSLELIGLPGQGVTEGKEDYDDYAATPEMTDPVAARFGKE